MPQETTTNIDPAALLDAAFRTAIATALEEPDGDFDPVIRVAQNPEFGDYQCNAAMAVAKQRQLKPRDLAERIIEAVDLGDLAEPPEVAGPGFINIRLKPEALGSMLESIDEQGLGLPQPGEGHSIAVDLCGVNVAKQMHVGHLRSTIIGDAIARLHERLGWTVHRENHLGDWGLPIAMTLTALRDAGTDLRSLELEDLNTAYRDAQLSGKPDRRGLEGAHANGCGPHRIIELEEQNAGSDEAITRAKDTLIKLQSGDAALVDDWNAIIDCTMREVFDTLAMLNVKIGPEHNRGESFYKDILPEVVEAFIAAGLGIEDDGAIVVRFEDRDRPLLIRKSDGGFLYATTDLAAIRHRVRTLDSDRLVYVVDARQRDHFKDVFGAAHLIGWDRTEKDVQSDLHHLPFGAVLGKDKKPLKTRSGENFTLRALLEEAIERGSKEVIARSEDEHAPTHGATEEELRAIGRAVGIAAVKYADLSSGVVKDYVFDLDRMIAFEGDTGPYILYAHARICSIIARGRAAGLSSEDAPFKITTPEERRLAIALLRYRRTVTETTDQLEPHRLCGYLHELANQYSAFYQACPVLKADDEATRRSRLRMCDLVRRTLEDGLDLLGIEAPERM
ncbi:MAG: arginine--tRNA ligase [Phycisphaerales bacterium]|nr:arginine--tRNA ligase [Phycisphaerales bacterium]